MLHTRAYRVLLLAFVLLVSTSLTPFLQPLSSAQSIGQTRTLYFHEYDPELLLAEATVDESPPTKQNDSFYPPKIFVDNESRIFIPDINSDDWLNWFLTSWIFYFFQLQDEFNLSDEFGDDLSDDFWDLFEGFELLFPHPYRIVEMYEYSGTEDAEIDGTLDFNLYFSSKFSSKMRQKDSVKVSLYSMSLAGFGIPRHIANTTVQLSPRLLDIKPYLQRISLGPINQTLQTGDMLVFSLEVIPSNKTVTTALEKIIDISSTINKRFNITERLKLADRLANNSQSEFLRELGMIINDLQLILEDETLGINITSSDIAEIFKSSLTTKLVYDSLDHPASVTVPFRVPGEPPVSTFYLHNEDQMTTEAPSGEDALQKDVLAETAVWQTPAFSRSKILEEAYARLYIDHTDLFRMFEFLRKPIEITATLYDGTTSIASSSHTFDRTRIWNIQETPQEPIVFSFSDITPREIIYDSRLRLEVAMGNASQTRVLKFLRSAQILYDSELYPSSLIIQLNETNNIQADVSSVPAEGKILPGRDITFHVNVTSKYADSITIDIKDEPSGEWDISYDESELSIPQNGNKSIPVTVRSTNPKTSAYGDKIFLDFIVTGKTGRTTVSDQAEVSEEAIIYDIILIGQTESREIKKGNTGAFYFRIKNNNTGAEDGTDSYTILSQSKNNWNVESTEEILNLKNGATTGPEDILVILQIPKNTTLTKDVLTITVSSQNNPGAQASMNVTINVVDDDLFTQLYERIQSASESLGLDEYFGDNAGYALLGIIFLILALLLFIILILIRKPFAFITLTEPVKDIQPDQAATFEITLKNPRRKTQTYQLHARAIQQPSKWDINSNHQNLRIPPLTTQHATITVTPTDQIESDDWTEIDITIKKGSRQKTIHGLIQIKKGNTNIQITKVSSWPKTFKKGNRIITTCHVHNKGTLAARNVQITLLINGKEKNSITTSIPAGGYAEVQLPWIAGKGRNHLHIKAVEQ